MSGVNEAASQQGGQFQANLFAGMQQLSGAREIAFTQYTRYVLPLDGYVFWRAVKQTRLTGVLHFDAREQQLPDESFTIMRVVFTTTEKIREFEAVNPNILWIGEAMGTRFTFSEQGMFFQQSGVYHYRGDAVYPALETQLVDLGAEYPTTTLIVSNSLPAWLTLRYYNPPWLVAGNPGVTLYPAFLVPDNLRPPYGVIFIPEDRTAPMAGLPVIGQMGQHTQLAYDEVNITLYGLTNIQAAAFLDLVIQYSSDTDAFGLMGASVIRDAHRPQVEISALAMKKTFRFEVDYLQQAMPNVALKLIKSAPVIIYPQLEI